MPRRVEFSEDVVSLGEMKVNPDKIVIFEDGFAARVPNVRSQVAGVP